MFSTNYQWILSHSKGFVHYTCGAGVNNVDDISMATVVRNCDLRYIGNTMEYWSERQGFMDSSRVNYK